MNIGDKYQIIGCQYGGLGDLFRAGDTVTIVNINDAPSYIQAKLGNGTVLNFHSNDLVVCGSVIRLSDDEVSEKFDIFNAGFKTINLELKRGIEEKLNYIGRIESDLRKAYTEIHKMDILMRSNNSKIGAATANKRGLFEVLMDSYSSIYFSNGYLIARTKDVKIKYVAHRDTISHELEGEYNLGAYDIRIGIFDNKLTIKQADMTKRPLDRPEQHPHVQGEGVPCLGSYGFTINKEIAEYRYLEALQTISLYLNSVNPSDWYCPIFFWNRAIDLGDYCGDCWAHVDNCQCDRCEECGRHHDDCECITCPDTHDRLQDNSFPDRGCASCTYLRRNEPAGEWQCTYISRNNPEHTTYIEHYTPPNDVAHRFEIVPMEQEEATT